MTTKMRVLILTIIILIAGRLIFRSYIFSNEEDFQGTENPQQVFEEARQNNKPILIDFYSDL